MEDPRESFNELMDTPLDFSAFVMNRLKVDTLTPELLASPTFELMKGSCKSLVELEYFFEEVYKATTNQLDWSNPEGQQYPHDLRKPLQLIPNSRGRRVIPFDHFINNDLTYLSGGVSSQTYTTSVRPRLQITGISNGLKIWSLTQCGVKYRLATTNMHSGESHIGGENNNNSMNLLLTGNLLEMSTPNAESFLLRIQDIKDMMLLLVQGKLTNLTVEERLAFNVSLRMFTRSVVIQRHVEDLQLDALIMSTASAAAKPCQGDSSEFYLITGNVVVMRMASAAAKPCQEDSLEFYLITAGSRQVKIHSHMLILDQHIDEVLKLKNFKKDENTSFQEQKKFEHVGLKVTSTQDGKRSQDDDSRLCTADDLKKDKNHMQLLPYGLQQYLDTDVAKLIIELCLFFKQICARTLMEDDMVKAESQLIDILCNPEQIYPPAFFERYMKKLKHYVRNKANPKGSIAEGYVAEEALTFYKDPSITDKLFALACGPSSTPISVNSCVVNYVRFVVYNRDERHTAQNIGICSPGKKDREMYYGQLEEILEFLYMSFKVVLFRFKWFDTRNEGCKLKNFVIRNNITQILASSESFKDQPYILATQVKQVFYLEDMAKRPLHWKVFQDVNHEKFSNGSVIVVEEDHDVKHNNNSSDLALSTHLNDLDFATLNIDCQSTNVEAPPDIIDVDDEDDLIDDKDDVPHDLVYSYDEVLANDDDDDDDDVAATVVYSSDEED
ncbi:hypothetical protein Tco_0744137 [Tanacetum coccineum]